MRPLATHEHSVVMIRSSRRIVCALCAVLVATAAGCARFEPTTPAVSPSDYGIGGMEQSFTMKNSSIHYDPAVLSVGTAQSQVRSAYGEPNASRYNAARQLERIYAFNPDGTKFVDP